MLEFSIYVVPAAIDCITTIVFWPLLIWLDCYETKCPTFAHTCVTHQIYGALIPQNLCAKSM